MKEGWYLMSVTDLEIELARMRGEDRPPSHAKRLSIDDALSVRNAGNLPDEHGRTLRLFLEPDPAGDVSLEERRLEYEPDFMNAPEWKREGSRRVNVVPLRPVPTSPGAWWEDEDMAALEGEWRETGAVVGLAIPGEYRSFVYKTIALLRSTGTPVTVASISDSIARWLQPDQAEQIREALKEANPEAP